MARVTHRDFSKGLWLAGPRDIIPATALRRATGVRPFTRTGAAIRSRWGNQRFATGTVAITDLLRFANKRYAHFGTNFGEITAGTYSTAFVGTFAGKVLAAGCTLYGASAVPTLETDVTAFPNGPEHFFVAGSKCLNGGSIESGNTDPFKISTDGILSRWGMPAPTLAWSASADAPIVTPVLNDFESGPAFVPDPATLANVSAIFSAVNKQVGSGSRGMAVVADAYGSVSFAIAANLLTYTGPGGTSATSPREDYIRLWVFVDRPEALDSLEIILDVTAGAIPAAGATGGTGGTDGLNDTFSFIVRVEDSATDTAGITGTADDPRVESYRKPEWTFQEQPENQQVQKGKRRDNSGTVIKRPTIGDALGLSDAATSQILTDLATLKISAKGNTWTLLRIPKKLFTTAGKATQGEATKSGDRTWAHVRRVRFGARTNENGAVAILFDEMGLQLGAGMHGDYQYAITYKNSKTGHRGNPSEIKTVKKVERNTVLLAGAALLKNNMPPDADRIEVWRSLGNGIALFKIDEFDPLAQAIGGQYNDFVADYKGIQEDVRIGIGTRTTKYMTDEQLPFDNEPPDDLTKDVAGPYLGSLWTISTKKGDRGKVFYSPPGRPESIGGFIIITGEDDPTQRVIDWHGIYVWTEEGVYTIEGNNPFIGRKIHGVPGTNDPKSVIPSPFGVLYKATDGIRLFNGSGSSLVFPDAMEPLFNTETVTGIAAPLLSVSCAAYHKSEYFIGDGTTTYAVSLRNGSWRNCSYAAKALMAERDTGLLIGAVGLSAFAMEVPNVTSDDGTAISFIVETPGVILEDQSEQTKIVQRVYFDGNTNGQSLTALLLLANGSTASLGTFSASLRGMVEFALLVPSEITSVRLTGSLTQEVEIAGVYYDVHLPEKGGELT